jgi:hippurate hydrolase
VLALQTIASRNVDPTEQIVVSVTSIESESKAFNVIPEHVFLKGTIRTMSADIRKLAERRLKEISTSVATMFGGQTDIKFNQGYPVMTNSEEQTQFAASVAASVYGSCEDAPLVMGGEDFSYMLNERPGAYILVGNGDTAACHHPEYNFSDDAIPSGCSFWAEIIEKRLPR